MRAQAFPNFIQTVTTGLNTIIVFLFLVATVIFLFGIVRYITAGADEDRVAEARNMIIWGIIFLAVMLAVWGFVEIVSNFFLGSRTVVPIPGRGGGAVPQQ